MQKTPPPLREFSKVSQSSLLSKITSVKILRASMLAVLSATIGFGGGVCCATPPAPKPQVVMCAPEISKEWLEEPSAAKEIMLYALKNLQIIFPDIKPGIINETHFVYRGIRFLARLSIYPDQVDDEDGMGLSIEITEDTKIRSQYRTFTPMPEELIEI